MKGKKCLGHLLHSRVFSAFFLLLLSLLLSLYPVKTNAVSYVVNLSFQKELTSNNWTYYYKYGSNSLQNFSSDYGLTINRKGNDSSTYPEDPFYIVYMCTNDSYSITKDNYYNFKIFTGIKDSTTDVLGTFTAEVSSSHFSIIDVSISYEDENSVSHNKIIYNTSGTLGDYNIVYSYDNYPQQLAVFDITLKAFDTGNFPICFGRNINRYIYTLPAMDYGSPNVLSYSYRFYFKGNNKIYEYSIDSSSEDMNEKDEQDRDNLENQKTESQDSSDDSQEDAENTGTTLLAAFSSFVTAITSASPSNCNLLMNMGNLNLGNVNLCQLSPPVEFQAIASIFLILFCVPLSIATARKVINLFRSFQT